MHLLRAVEQLRVADLFQGVADRLEGLPPDPRAPAGGGQLQDQRMQRLLRTVGERFDRLGLDLLAIVFARNALERRHRGGIVVAIAERLDRLALDGHVLVLPRDPRQRVHHAGRVDVAERFDRLLLRRAVSDAYSPSAAAGQARPGRQARRAPRRLRSTHRHARSSR